MLVLVRGLAAPGSSWPLCSHFALSHLLAASVPGRSGALWTGPVSLLMRPLAWLILGALWNAGEGPMELRVSLKVQGRGARGDGDADTHST